MEKNHRTIDRRIVKSKMAMKEALLSLMQEKEFKHISITEIVKEADVNRGTFYKHYVYKEELLDEMITDITKDLIESFRDPYKDLEKVDIRFLTSKAVKIFEHVEKHASFYTLIVKSNLFFGFQNILGQEIKGLLLNDFINHLEYEQIDSHLLASYHAYAIVGMIIEWVRTDFKYSAEFMAEQLLNIIRNNKDISMAMINKVEKA
ncbi:TetR/AcrR family transcriptional regulator [Alkalihalobacterium bogoriense]|uniref:TetR/AcrR family transcriptional regulator n=1 Tax=Alkalihalobacterium bogoriense TaxID=246272 RepID=UPI00047B361D|nr:TetR/AcrR family transcriptional regulator [Alkalihalobacterium bogoriense]